MNMLKTATTSKDFEAIGAQTLGLSTNQLKLVLSTNTLTNAQRVQILTGRGVAAGEEEQALATMGLTTAQVQASGATFSLTGAMNALKVAFATNPIGIILTGITLAVSALTMGISSHNQKQEEMRQKIEESANAAKDESENISSLLSSYNDLSEAVKNGTGSKKDLLTIQNDLLESLGSEAGQVDDLVKKYGDLDTAINTLALDKLKQNEGALGAAIASSEKELSKAGESGFVNKLFVNSDNEVYDKLKSLNLRDLGLESLDTKALGLSTLTIFENTSTQQGIKNTIDGLTKLRNKVGDLYAQEGKTPEYLSSDFFEKINNEITKLQTPYEKLIADQKAFNENQAGQQLLSIDTKTLPKTITEFESFKNKMIETAQTSGNFVGTQEDVKTAILAEMALFPQFKQFLSDIAEASDDIGTNEVFTNSLSDIQESYDLLKSVTEEYKEYKKISLETLTSIAKKYPELQTAVMQYTQGLISADDVMAQLQTSYNNDAEAFRLSMLSKVKDDETFFTSVKNNHQELFASLAGAYDTDISNWKTLAQAKADIDKSLVSQLAGMWGKYYGSFDENIVQGKDGQYSAVTDDPTAVYESGWQAIEEEVAKRNQMVRALNEAAAVEIKIPDFGGIGSVGKDKKEKSKKEDNPFDWIKVQADQAQKNVKKVQDQINDVSNWLPKNNLSDTAISEMSKQIEALQAQADAYQSEAESYGLSPSYIDKIKNGALEIENITDEVIAKNVKGYQDAYNKAEDFRDKIDDVKKAMKELAQSKLDNIINDFSSLVSLMEKYSSYNKSLIELHKDLGEEISSTDYEKLIDQQKGIYDELQNKYKTLSDELHNAVRNGAIKVGSQEWRKYNEELIDVNNSMNDVVSNMNDFRKSMIDLPFEELERITDATSRVNNEISSMLELIGNDGLVDGGMPTSKGLARLALLGKQLANAKQETANYGEAIEAVEEAYSNGTLTQAEYNERINEYSSAQMTAVNATKAAQDAILQFRYDAIQAEIDDMNKLIDAKKKALQSEKEYQDYLDEINGKQNDISNLQKKIDELSLSTDRRDIAQRLQLEEDMAKAKEELAKTQADNAYNKTLESLDKQGEEYEKSKNNELETLKSNTDAQEKVIKDYLGQVKDNYKTVYSTLTKYGSDYNITMTDELTSPWASASSAVDTFQSAVSDAISQINIDIASIDLSKLTEMVSTMSGFSGGSSGSGGFEDITGSGTWRKAKDGQRWWYGSSDDDYASDGTYSIGGNQYGFDENGYMLTGWSDATGDWRYFEPENGQMVKSTWRDYKGKQYYLKSDGTMATDMAIKSKSENGYYYVGNDGAQEGGLISYDEVKQRKLTVGYKNGTTDSKPGLKKVYEDGPELIITGDGVALNSVGHDVIFTKAMTDNLRNIAVDPTEFILGNMPKFERNSFAPVNRNNVSVSIDSPLMVVQGNADEKVLAQMNARLESFIKKDIPEKIMKITTQN